jgi:hypothetical protein
VTFSDDVKVIGDGSREVLKADPSTFNDYNFMLKNGKACADTQFVKPIKDTF